MLAGNRRQGRTARARADEPDQRRRRVHADDVRKPDGAVLPREMHAWTVVPVRHHAALVVAAVPLEGLRAAYGRPRAGEHPNHLTVAVHDLDGQVVGLSEQEADRRDRGRRRIGGNHLVHHRVRNRALLQFEALGDRESRSRTAEQGQDKHHRQDPCHGLASLVRTPFALCRSECGMAEEREPESGGELREERKVVTALFADLVGSTALGERLDPEEVRLIVGEAVARMVARGRGVRRHGEGPGRRRRPGAVRRPGRARGRRRAGRAGGARGSSEEIDAYARRGASAAGASRASASASASTPARSSLGAGRCGSAGRVRARSATR